MDKKGIKERRMLVECAREGFNLLERHIHADSAGSIVPSSFIPFPSGLAGELEGLLYSNHPDVFYSFLSLLHSTNDEGLVRQTIQRKDVKEDILRALDVLEATLYQESDFERELEKNITRYTESDDEEIRRRFSQRFKVTSVDMMTLPVDRSIYFAKVNHGYWEYMRGAYDIGYSDREQFRDINLALRRRRLRNSGVTQYWGRQIQGFIQNKHPSDKKQTNLCISLTAGTEPPGLSIRNKLSPVTRGAAIGLLSMFETTLPDCTEYSLGDGAATRNLIFDRTLAPFVEKYVSDSEACLFVVPPHLAATHLVGYRGKEYKFIVPPTRINETWKTVAATLLGYLQRLGKQHRSITVLAQGASVASLMALIFSEMEVVPGLRLRFIDLGRVLDVAAPEFLEKQAWAKQDLEAHVEEGRKVFCTKTDGDLVLASRI